ncbi:MAG: nucleotidyltransferase [Chloroflexi bacterium]|nr:nucleotidyltransferase [Chloroflexota bacterium]
MNPRFEAAWEIHQFLNKHSITYAVIGGIAVQKWGDQRFTRDVDLSVATPLVEGSAPIIRLITGHFPSRSADPFTFARQTRMILVTASNGVEVDISLALPGYEDEMFARTIEYELEAGKSIHLCSPEDLIIHKAVAGRPQDIFDIQGIIYRQGEKLDLGYIRGWLAQFAEVLENSEVQSCFEDAWQRYLTP